MQMRDGKLITALLVERLGYERRGLHERAALVTQALRDLGYDEPNAVVEIATVEPAAERTVKRRAKKRGE
jgi:hypothetical protein